MWISQNLTNEKSLLVQAMAWCQQQAIIWNFVYICHGVPALNFSDDTMFPGSMSASTRPMVPNGVTSPQWINHSKCNAMQMGFSKFIDATGDVSLARLSFRMMDWAGDHYIQKMLQLRTVYSRGCNWLTTYLICGDTFSGLIESSYDYHTKFFSDKSFHAHSGLDGWEDIIVFHPPIIFVNHSECYDTNPSLWNDCTVILCMLRYVNPRKALFVSITTVLM